jgi:thiamine transporter
MDRRRIRITIEIALTIALATVLSMFTVWRMPYGGSVSLGMLPLIVFAFRRGLGPGLAAGALYGIIDLLVDPYIVHWVQPILDYPVAYLFVGLAGVVRPALDRAFDQGMTVRAGLLMAAGVALAAAGRYAAHFASGIIFFSEFAPPEQPVWLYSAIYNLYVPASAAASLVAALVIVPLLARVAPVSSDTL